MKFAHLADVHLGCWRDPELRELNSRAFEKAIDACIGESVDFVILAGDLFDNAMPAFDVLESAIDKIRQLKDNGIPVFAVAGSHDFSPSGKTIISILEKAGLLTNVAKGEEREGKLSLKFVEARGAHITGMFGKPGALERQYYENLNFGKMPEGPKIFVFHSPIESCIPKELSMMETIPLSLLPKGFDYYAGGHIHTRFDGVLESKHIVYPGAVFPCDFHELEKFKRGYFTIVESSEGDAFKSKSVAVEVCDVKLVDIDFGGKTAKGAEAELLEIADDFKGKVVLLKLRGQLGEGKVSDIDFTSVSKRLKDRGALIVKKNISKLTSREYREVKIRGEKVNDIEDSIIREHAGQIKVNAGNEERLIKDLMSALAIEKKEGETVSNFESRLLEGASRLLKNHKIENGEA